MGEFFKMLNEIIGLINKQELESMEKLEDYSENMLMSLGIPLRQIVKLKKL
jgi:hypothetical protein